MSLWHFKNDSFYLDLTFVEKLDWLKVFILIWLINMSHRIWVTHILFQVHACEEENWKAWVELSNANLIKIRVYLSIFYFSLENFDGTDNFPKYPNEVDFQNDALNSPSYWLSILTIDCHLIGLEWHPISIILKILTRTTDL